MNSLAARIAEIAPFQVMEVQTAARALEAQGRSVIHLEIGEPDFPTPAPVIAEAHAAIAKGDLYYTSALGIPELRAAIAKWYGSHYGVRVAPERVMVTAGSSAALLLTLALLIDRDDEVLLADPGYPCNRHFVRVLEGRPAAIPVGPETNYQLTADLVERHWSPRTRCVLVATPSNPTGTRVEANELLRIAEVVQAHGGSLIVDEIYLGLSYGERPNTVLKDLDSVYVINSFSKYFNMTGWRLGWLVAPPGATSGPSLLLSGGLGAAATSPQEPMRDLEKLAQNLYISAAAPSQRAALACFRDETIAVLEARRLEFQARRDFLLPALRELGFGIPVVPQGGFFVYADCSRFSKDSLAFCRNVLEATGVAITPGVDFGHYRAGEHVRIAYTVSLPKLEEAVQRLRDHLR